MIRTSLVVNGMLLALSGVAGLWARSNAEPEVLVRLVDAGMISPQLMFPAKDTAKKILASAGVGVTWGKIGCASEGAVEVIDLRFAYFTPAAYKPGALAEAHPYARSGVRITVFFDRLSKPLRLYQLSAGAILGHVLAHEIGHVLLGVCDHAETGLMKAHWTDRDYSPMALKNLEFTASDANSIRRNLASDQAPPSRATATPSRASNPS